MNESSPSISVRGSKKSITHKASFPEGMPLYVRNMKILLGELNEMSLSSREEDSYQNISLDETLAGSKNEGECLFLSKSEDEFKLFMK